MESNKKKVFQYHPKILNLARKGAFGAAQYEKLTHDGIWELLKTLPITV